MAWDLVRVVPWLSNLEKVLCELWDRERRTARCAVEYLWEVSSLGSHSGRYKYGLLEKKVACISV